MNRKRRWLLPFFGAMLSAGAAELIWTLDLDDPQIQKQVAKCPYAKISKDFEGTNVLSVTVPPEALKKGEFNLVTIPLNLAKLGVPGQNLIGEGDILYRDVSKPKYNYNGVKCQLHYFENGKPQWKEFYKTKQETVRYGSIPKWTHFRESMMIRKDSSRATLNLGLQDSSGTISFRNFRLYKGDALSPSTLEMKQIPQAVYTIPPSPGMRGVMSPKFLKEEDFAELRRWGANLIRWQMTPAPLRIGNYTWEQWRDRMEERINELQKVLDTAQKYGIRVVVDLHTTGGRQTFETRKGHEYLVEFWKKTAARYKGHPAIYGYDIMNEPHSRYLRPGFPSWNELADRTIRAIREIDPVTPVIVEPDFMAAPHMLEYLPVFPYPNVIYSIHTYNPGSLTHQLNPREKKFVGYPDGRWNKQTAIRDWLEPVRKFQRKTGARIYVGEFGCVRWVPGAEQYIKDSIDFFEECGWDWTYHAFREWHGWSAEHSDDPSVMTPVPTTKRKEVLLEAFKKNRR